VSASQHSSRSRNADAVASAAAPSRVSSPTAAVNVARAAVTRRSTSEDASRTRSSRPRISSSRSSPRDNASAASARTFR
jgi:hypothetical protein